MSAGFELWLFWVVMVTLIATCGVAPLVLAVRWTADRDGRVPIRALAVGVVYLLIWMPLIVIGVGFALAPWAHSLGLEWSILK